MKITNLISGPHEEDDEVWCLFNVTDGHNVWSDEVYYTDMDECMSDLEVLRTSGYIEAAMAQQWGRLT